MPTVQGRGCFQIREMSWDRLCEKIPASRLSVLFFQDLALQLLPLPQQAYKVESIPSIEGFLKPWP